MSTSSVTGNNRIRGGGSAPLPTKNRNENGSGVDVHNGNGGKGFQLVGDSTSTGRIDAIFAEDFTRDVIVLVPKDQIVPYGDLLPFSEENQANIQKMLAGITFNDPSLLTLSTLIINKVQRESIIAAGKALKGISVLKMLEYIVSKPELKAQIKIIFKYPSNGGFLSPTNYILSKIRKKFFSSLSSYLETNIEEIQQHLKDFVKAIGKDKIVIEGEPLPALFKRAIEQEKWDSFFAFVIFDDDDE